MVRTRIDLGGRPSHAEAARDLSAGGTQGQLLPGPPLMWTVPPGLPMPSIPVPPPPGLSLPPGLPMPASTSTPPPPGLDMRTGGSAIILRDVLSKHTPPVQETGACVRSRGSVCHMQGLCLPCQFMRSKKGCLDGADCVHCHYPHEEMTTSAIRRAHRRASERRAEKLEPSTPDTPTSLNSDAASALSDEDPSEYSSVPGLDVSEAPSLACGALPPQIVKAMLCARPRLSSAILSTDVVPVAYITQQGVERL
mmetsp:Transcript_68717/g.192687  ORF Transcript_68717/g.192687 Transcript_68717/m.192687 type:complete len:252 (-) Transcript_68717:86-841(-)